ncbi:MAG: carbohydrate binding domain-containing protein [Candidatus Hydrogenedentes bacterium]|nr:carbohydrate binding domain-containing protein [Candidatus Hydrogenedentota bacterium]
MCRVPFLALFAAVLSGTALAAEDLNLIDNGSFEVLRPEQWTTHTWGGEAEFGITESGHTGGYSVSLSSASGADASWVLRLSVQPHTQYRLTGWIKTENVATSTGRGALLNIHEMAGAETPAITGTTDWKQVEVLFDPGDKERVQVNCLLGGWGNATGRAWFDDVSVAPVALEEGRPVARLDGDRTGAPISKYIYGQFIEHLGRCIYGGIWAEMIEDRKFFDPVGMEPSPWKVVGDPGAAEATSDHAFVGKHAVHLMPGTSPQGLAQDGLGLRAGIEYEGHIVLMGTPEAVVEVQMIWGAGRADRASLLATSVGETYAAYPLHFRAAVDTQEARLEILCRGHGYARIGTVSLMPADNINGMRADTLAVLKELNAPIYRWPGGNFVSGYDWRVALGERDKRPPMKNPAWGGIEHHDFGLDEYMTFCREVGAEPLVVVNSGLGDVRMAVEEIQYCNAPMGTPQGERRAANGHPDSYNVRWWGVGNEMYGEWQLGHMPLEEYVKKHITYADALRAVTPEVRIVGVGATGVWSQTMLAQASEHMDLLSEHFYCGEGPNIIAHVAQIPNNIRAKVEAHRRYHETLPELKGKKIPIALDEWNYWYGPHVYGELGTRYFLKDALGVAAGLHEYFRNSDWIEMANYAQTVNVIGCTTTSKTAATLATTGQVLALYRRHFGEIPITVEGVPAPLDVAAAWTNDRGAFTVGIVNPTRETMTVKLELTQIRLGAGGDGWIITHADPMAHNVPGESPQVAIQPLPAPAVPDTLPSPPLSIVLYRLPASQ